MHVDWLLILNLAYDLCSQSERNAAGPHVMLWGVLTVSADGKSHLNSRWRTRGPGPAFVASLALGQTHFKAGRIKSILPWQSFPLQPGAQIYCSKLGSDPTPFSQRRRGVVQFGKVNIEAKQNESFLKDGNNIHIGHWCGRNSLKYTEAFVKFVSNTVRNPIYWS